MAMLSNELFGRRQRLTNNFSRAVVDAGQEIFPVDRPCLPRSALRRTKATTLWPFSSKKRTVGAPVAPVESVTRNFLMQTFGG
jgi:hypothetical protein